jgi:hypothetical protein
MGIKENWLFPIDLGFSVDALPSYDIAPNDKTSELSTNRIYAEISQ